MLKKAFLYRIALHEPKKQPFFANQKVFFCRKLYALLSKAAFFTFKKPFIRTNLSLFPPKITLFCPPPPLSTPLNLLFAKNTAVLLLFALILCCKAGISHRFKSLPAIPGKLAVFCVAGYLMNAGRFRKKSRIDRRFESSPESRGSQTSGVLFGSFCTTQKERKNVPFAGSSEVLQTSNQHTVAAASHRNN